ncbi:hypothetical protein, partial [Halobacillus litoralis]|uniref:hypothetical protein n=1 Tax=Halobacillus litoralis TaxID=45668 RepID=UPI001F2184B2
VGWVGLFCHYPLENLLATFSLLLAAYGLLLATLQLLLATFKHLLATSDFLLASDHPARKLSKKRRTTASAAFGVFLIYACK